MYIAHCWGKEVVTVLKGHSVKTKLNGKMKSTKEKLFLYGKFRMKSKQ